MNLLDRVAEYIVAPKREAMQAEFVERRADSRRIESLLDMLEERERKLARTNARLQGILDSQLDLLVFIGRNHKIEFANKAYLETFGLTVEQVKGGYDFTQLVHPDDMQCSQRHWEAIQRPPYRTRHEQRCRTVRGWRWFEWEGWLIRDENGKPAGMGGSGRDITERKDYEEILGKARALEKSATDLLVLIAQREPLRRVLHELCLHMEKHDSGIRASILLFDHDSGQLVQGAAPSLPAEYNALLEAGLPIGPTVGTCGQAAATMSVAYAEHIQTSPNWTPYPEYIRLTEKHRLHACWSVPIRSSEGMLLGTVANYYHQPAEPTVQNIQALTWAAMVAGIAIEQNNFDMRWLQAQENLAKQLVEQQHALRACEISRNCPGSQDGQCMRSKLNESPTGA